MKYLNERYKSPKDWNSYQNGGHRRESIFYEEIDIVLGCRDAVILRNEAEEGASSSSAATMSEASETVAAGQETSHEGRTE